MSGVGLQFSYLTNTEGIKFLHKMPIRMIIILHLMGTYLKGHQNIVLIMTTSTTVSNYTLQNTCVKAGFRRHNFLGFKGGLTCL